MLLTTHIAGYLKVQYLNNVLRHEIYASFICMNIQKINRLINTSILDLIRHGQIRPRNFEFAFETMNLHLTYHRKKTAKKGNAWAFLSIFNSMGICRKNHLMWRAWKIGTRTFPKAWVAFCHQIPTL